MKHRSFVAMCFLGYWAGQAGLSQSTELQVPVAPNGISLPAGGTAQPGATGEPARPNATGANRLREGSKIIDQIGDFQKSVERINFFPKEGPAALRVLENLALERVVRALEDNPTMRTWSVTGVITEFRGENYLLITRAVVKGRSRSESLPERPLTDAPAKSDTAK